MKNILILIVFISIIASRSNAQIKLDDFGRIVLNAFLPDRIPIPTEAKGLLLTKLNQITSNNGMGGSETSPRFIITAAVNLGTKDIIAGPPQLIAQNVDITMFVGDALTKWAETMTVGASSQKRRMVGTYQDPVVTLRLQPGMQRADNMLVNLFDSMNLLVHTAFMGGFICGLN